MHDFRYVRGKLFCEGVALESLAQKFGTPLYVYSQHTLTDHFQKLDRAMAGLDHLICFAVKSNSNLSILRLLANLGSGFDIVSGGELQRVISAGGDPAKCAFAGVGKTAEEIILDAVKEYDYPVCFGFPAGHQTKNLALFMGKKARLSVGQNVILSY